MWSAHTFIVDGAVPDIGDLLSQVALLLEAQLSAPPPLFVMLRDPLT